MSNRLQNIIKKGVMTLLEDRSVANTVWGSPDSKGKQVVKDKEAFHLANAEDTLNDIDQAFRELGISVNPNELATIDILKSMEPFEMSFKINKRTKFFDGNTKISGKAKIGSVSNGLDILFKSDKGENVKIHFDKNSLEGKQPQTGAKVTVLMENTSYMVQLGGKAGKTPSLDSLSKISFLTSKKGITYLVAPNPSKQSDVKEGYINVTLVGDDSDPQPNRSFAVPKSKLKKTPDGDEYVTFPEDGGKPQRVQPMKLIITSLPNVKLNTDSEDDNSEFKLDEVVTVTGKLESDVDLNFKSKITLDSINSKLERGVEAEFSKSQQKGNVVKLNMGNDQVVMLEPKGSNPRFVSNWNNMSVEIGDKAKGQEDWRNTKGTASLKIVK